MIDWIEYLNIERNYIGNEINKKCIKFILLWIRYNNYYNKHYKKEDNPKYKNEKERAKALNSEHVKNKYELLKNDFLNNFKNLPNNEPFKTYIKNLKNQNNIQYNHENSNLDDFLAVVYQIRCNLLHGDKLSRDYDAKIIAWAYDCLNQLLKDTIF